MSESNFGFLKMSLLYIFVEHVPIWSFSKFPMDKGDEGNLQQTNKQTHYGFIQKVYDNDNNNNNTFL